MKLNKTCPCCKIELTTKNTRKVARGVFIGGDSLYLNCLKCLSTTVILKKAA